MPDNNDQMRHRPNVRPIYVSRVVACRAVYDNQSTIDALNGVLANCDKLKYNSRIKCDDRFVSAVEKELMHQLSIGRYIGQSCDNTNLGTITYRY